MSLLTIVQGVARRCNYSQPSSAMSSADSNITLMVDCVQDIGDELIERWGWQALKIRIPVTFIGDGTTTAFAMPSNVENFGPSSTFVSNAYPTLTMPGPVLEEDLLRIKALPMFVQPSCWRQVDNFIEFYPAPAAGEVISYVYGQNSWVLNAAGVPYATPAFVADTDTTALDERLLRLGAIQLWKRRKGYEYAEELEDFERAFDRQAGQENTGRVIGMSSAMGGGGNMFAGKITGWGDFNDDFGSDFG